MGTLCHDSVAGQVALLLGLGTVERWKKSIKKPTLHSGNGPTVTVVFGKLVSPEQILPDAFHQVTGVDNETKLHPIAMVRLD